MNDTNFTTPSDFQNNYVLSNTHCELTGLISADYVVQVAGLWRDATLSPCVGLQGSIINRVHLKQNIYEGTNHDLNTPCVFNNNIVNSRVNSIELFAE
jgi:hypothetical protein